MIDEVRVWTTLNTIVDPCSRAVRAPAGIAEMGTGAPDRGASEPRGASIRVVIGVQTPGCLVGAAFVNDARPRLRELPGVAEVHVSMDQAFAGPSGYVARLPGAAGAAAADGGLQWG